jgi:hypothetical protein
MPSKHLLPKKVADSMHAAFRAKIDSLAAAGEIPLTEDKVIGAFRETLEKMFIIVDEHGNVVTKNDPKAIFSDPGYNPDPDTGEV